MSTYKDRTPASILQEHEQYTYKGVEELAKFLNTWMANDHNDRRFLSLYEEAKKDKAPPHIIAEQLLGHALDWFKYGN